ncbi:4-hydroxythreonine-4-phosphate dehydrogenase PdxA, partial [Candidatus Gracilibacteria bacterium]|nr:4-hydroxythreonine-4-phosphate dehydrogenase PdxA [Candidatus Gracilibacteria bacterium]
MITEVRPRLAITLGDPAGIGPEVVLKALSHPAVAEICQPLIIGDQRILSRAAAWLDHAPRAYELIDLHNADPATCPVGQLSAAAGRAAVAYVFHACDLALAGAVEAIVTAPLNKAAMHLAGFDYAGHTELLQARTKATRVSMLLIGASLRVVHVSTHLALEEAIRRVTKERVGTVIDLEKAFSSASSPRGSSTSTAPRNR